MYLIFSCIFFRTKLELCMHQWHGYDELYENLSHWLKDTEVKVRNESGLKPDLDAKQAQRDTFKVALLLLLFTVFCKILLRSYLHPTGQ